MASIPIYRFAPRHLGPCRPRADGGQVCTAVIRLGLVYWPVGPDAGLRSDRRASTSTSPDDGASAPDAAVCHRGCGDRRPSCGCDAVAGVAPAGPVNHPVPRRPGQSVVLRLCDARRRDRSRRCWCLRGSNAVPCSSPTALSIWRLCVVTGARIIHSRSQWAFLPNLLIPAALLLLGSGLFALMRPKIDVPSQ